MKPESLTFAVHFAKALVKVRDAVKAKQGVTLDAEEASALMEGINLMRPKKSE